MELENSLNKLVLQQLGPRHSIISISKQQERTPGERVRECENIDHKKVKSIQH